MKQKFTTWVAYLLAVATTLTVAMSFAGCSRGELYERDPDKDFEKEITFSVDQEGPFAMPVEGGDIKIKVTSNAMWSVKLTMTSANLGLMELMSEMINESFTSGEVHVKVNPNTGTRARSGDITISTKTKSVLFNVTQPKP